MVVDRQRLSNEQIVVVMMMNEFDKAECKSSVSNIRTRSSTRMRSYSRDSS